VASLHKYFVKDGAQNLTTHQTWPLTHADGAKLGELTARLHFDFGGPFLICEWPKSPGAGRA
jgi:hypothetical protein